MRLIAATLSGNAKVDINEKEKNELSKFSFELYGDLVPDHVPQTLIEALQFMKTDFIQINNQPGQIPIVFLYQTLVQNLT